MRSLRRGNGLYIPLVMIYQGRTRVMNEQKKKKKELRPLAPANARRLLAGLAQQTET